jgi:ribosomal-protein-alanine N-acetyltransferase
MQQLTITTGRLALRPIRLEDSGAIQAIAGRREIADTTVSVPWPLTQAGAVRYVAAKVAEAESGEGIALVAARRPEGDLIGLVELRAVEREHSQAELSYWVAVDAWGQGYGREMVAAGVHHGFEVWGLNRLYAYHMVRNPASAHVLASNGFRQEGVLRQRVRKWGRFEDVIIQAILREDWLRR